MGRVALTIEYDGTAYAGWQRQDNALTVQQVVEEALIKLTGVPIRITGASRTDAGVHARGQVAHFDNPATIPPERYAYALAAFLPPDISVQDSVAVPDAFHARFGAVGKRYTYTIVSAPHAPALLRDRCWHVPYALEAEAMRAALQPLLGEHDFAAFCASGSDVHTTVRTVTAADVHQAHNAYTLDISGNGFLYNMVRIIAGTMMYVGQGKLATDALARMIAEKDRLRGGPTAPPQGLVLERVYYRDNMCYGAKMP